MLQHIGLTGSEKLDALAVCRRGNWLYADLVEGCAVCCPDIRRNGMLGAVAGDIIGSLYEFHPAMSMDFPLLSEGSAWTDDTVLTMAVAETLLTGRLYEEALRSLRWSIPMLASVACSGGGSGRRVRKSKTASATAWPCASVPRAGHSTLEKTLAEA